MALLGSSIDPSLFSNDYSGFAQAGAIQGQMYAQMGKDIGGAISSVAQIGQQNKQMQGQVAAAEKGYESMAKAFPQQSAFFQSQAQGMRDPNISLAEKIGQLSSGQQLFGNMMQAQQMQNAYQARQLAAAPASAPASQVNQQYNYKQ